MRAIGIRKPIRDAEHNAVTQLNLRKDKRRCSFSFGEEDEQEFSSLQAFASII